jgi:hypothetical protein
MNNTPSYLPQAIHDLAAIADEGNLSDLQFAFAEECRKAGGLPHEAERRKLVNHMQANARVKARDIARVASHLFGISRDECERVALDVLLCDPWTTVALNLIEDYRQAAVDQAVETKMKPAPRNNGKPAARRLR